MDSWEDDKGYKGLFYRLAMVLENTYGKSLRDEFVSKLTSAKSYEEIYGVTREYAVYAFQ